MGQSSLIVNNLQRRFGVPFWVGDNQKIMSYLAWSFGDVVQCVFCSMGFCLRFGGSPVGPILLNPPPLAWIVLTANRIAMTMSKDCWPKRKFVISRPVRQALLDLVQQALLDLVQQALLDLKQYRGITIEKKKIMWTKFISACASIL